MAEEKSLTDRLMANIQKSAVINGIKAALKKYQWLKKLLPFLRDGIEGAKSNLETYLGETDKIIVLARKKGKIRLVILDGNKPFTLSTGMDIKCQKDGIEIKELDSYLKEFYDMGFFEMITEEDNKKYLEMKEKGIGLENFLQNNESPEQKQIESPKE